MRRLALPLALMTTLAACDPALEEMFPREVRSYPADPGPIVVRTQYDPFAFGYSVTVRNRAAGFSEADLDVVRTILTGAPGTDVCGETGLIAGDAPEDARYLPEDRAWVLFAKCG